MRHLLIKLLRWALERLEDQPPVIVWIPKPPTNGIVCPDCSGTKWYEGPEGGVAMNIKCANPACGHWFNYTYGIYELEPINRSD